MKKGAYTGADQDRDGLMHKAGGGVLFLDEVHRLPPQGQEMLFMYIDKGFFRPLGETEKTVSAQVRIIAATTYEPQSVLLKTFTRRIPMVITLPSLRERGLPERYRLIEYFLKDESKRLGRSIYVHKQALSPLLLYECPNNIGQLRSDIQLACARAFLNFKSGKESYIFIGQADIPHHVKKELIKRDCQEEAAQFFRSKGEILRFHHQDEQPSYISEDYPDSKHFYEIIESKMEELKSRGIPEEEINRILNVEIERYFQKYIGNLPHQVKKEELVKVAGEKTVEVVEQILAFARERLKREYDDQIYFGLALHLQGSIQRMQSGQKIFNPRLNFIRVNHPEEFLAAMEAAKFLDSEFNLETPLDEIGYLTLFLCANPALPEEDSEAKVGILVIMHGNSTAGSMAEVANSLAGAEHAVGLDIPLGMQLEEVYATARDWVRRLDRGRGVLLLVDMGAPAHYDDILTDETGIAVKTVEMASTPMVVDACRKAILNRSLPEIYSSCLEMGLSFSAKTATPEPASRPGKNAIITACFTGEGAAEKLKEILAEKLGPRDGLEIIALNILNRSEFFDQLERYRQEHHILAIVGTVGMAVGDIPFIPALEVIAGEGIGKVTEVIATEELFLKIAGSLKEHLSAADSGQLVEAARKAISSAEERLGVCIGKEVRVGITLHICFMVEKLLQNGKTAHFPGLKAYQDRYSRELLLVRESMQLLGKSFGFEIGEDETAYLCRMFLANDLKEL